MKHPSSLSSLKLCLLLLSCSLLSVLPLVSCGRNPLNAHRATEPCLPVTTPHENVCFATRCNHLFFLLHDGAVTRDPYAFGCNVTTFREYEDSNARLCLRATCYCREGYVGGTCRPFVANDCLTHRCVSLLN
eukprot:PhM_4_TR15731/c0_g2_i1/m.32213